MKRRISFVTATCAAIISVAGVESQTVAMIEDNQPCRQCRLEFKSLAVVGGSTEVAGLVSGMSRVSVDSRGWLFMAPTYSPGVINRYTPTGGPAGTFGGEGSGPGEARGIDWLVQGPGDSLYTFDPSNARINVWTPPGSYARSILLTHLAGGQIHSGVVLSDGRLVLQAMLRSPEAAGQPLQLVDSNGKLLRSFGSDLAEMRPSDPDASWRSVAVDGQDRVWCARLDRYELELWTPKGEHVRTLKRSVEWFPSNTRHTNEVPKPLLRAVQVDEHGYLWVLIQVPVPPTREKEQSADESTPTSWHEDWDTMIEVIDPVSAEVVMSQRLPDFIGWFAGLRTIGIYREADDGTFLIDVQQINLKLNE